MLDDKHDSGFRMGSMQLYMTSHDVTWQTLSLICLSLMISTFCNNFLTPIEYVYYYVKGRVQTVEKKQLINMLET